jgi:hypothetical protein
MDIFFFENTAAISSHTGGIYSTVFTDKINDRGTTSSGVSLSFLATFHVLNVNFKRDNRITFHDISP